MSAVLSALSVVVGIDGSAGATQAALWAVDEAVSRDIPWRLVYVIDPDQRLMHVEADQMRLTSARAALRDAQRVVEDSGEPVKVETDIVWGKPLVKLAEQSRSAALVCVGSIGVKHACHGQGSVAGALPGVARCPVAVIRRPSRRLADVGSVVVDADNDVALQHGFEEALLRRAPLRAVASWHAESPCDIADGNRLVVAQLDRRIARWKRAYPDVVSESIAVRGHVCRYVAKSREPVQLFVTGVRNGGCDSGGPGPVECSVLTVRGNHL